MDVSPGWVASRRVEHSRVRQNSWRGGTNTGMQTRANGDVLEEKLLGIEFVGTTFGSQSSARARNTSAERIRRRTDALRQGSPSPELVSCGLRTLSNARTTVVSRVRTGLCTCLWSVEQLRISQTSRNLSSRSAVRALLSGKCEPRALSSFAPSWRLRARTARNLDRRFSCWNL